MSTHAKLSPSGAHRWMACPGSSILIDELPSEFKRSSGHAQRGTAAHTLVEMCLRDRLPDSGQYLNYWINQAGEIQRAAPLGPDGTTSLSDGEDGWYIAKCGVDSTQHEKGFVRQVQPGSPTLTAEALEAMVGHHGFTHEDYLACTSAVRVLDEAKVMLHLRKRPEIVAALQEATVRGKTILKHALGKVAS